jgi:hypothetical protein
MIIRRAKETLVDNTADLPYMDPSNLGKAILPKHDDGKNAAEERGVFFGQFHGWNP